MPNAFKNANQDIGTSVATAYTCPASTTAIVLLCQVANIDGTNSVDVSVQWTDASNAAKVTWLVRTVTIPADASLGCIDGKLVLEAGDLIRAQADVAGRAMITISVLEIS